jgi:hypothetical protein
MSVTIRNADPMSWTGFWRDFAIGLAVFVVATLWLSVGPGEAFPMPPPIEVMGFVDIAVGVPGFIPAFRADVPAFAAPVLDRTAIVPLALAFAGVFAANIALVRHLRHAYLSAGE